MPESNYSRGGVFLSYAREDTEAAKRIADALRGFGVEVWFDQSELRGGDAWDANIKRQIRECSLFVAIISATTQARGEGYFRREWRLAIDRTHDMAAGIPFLIPVVIDQTLESKALVPEEFMKVQWTRLAGGIPTAQFVERIKRLAEQPKAHVEQSQGHPALSGAGPKDTSRKAAVPAWAWGVIAGVAIAAVAYIGLSRRTEPPAAEVKAEPKAEAPPPKEEPKADDKSIAVLPFANMSDEKDNEFFTDGIQEDILTNLALVHEIRVVSRTSVQQYRDTKKSIRQIASEFGVAYILEGSVRRAGNKVRVTGQLIHAATDEHVWAKAYDRDLTDIFGDPVRARPGHRDRAQGGAFARGEGDDREARPTENTEAYDLYLKSRQLFRIGDRAKQEALLEKAVALDPSFARAWGDLADEYAYAAFNYSEGVEERLAKAKAAIHQATQMAPDDPEVISSLGTYYYYGYRDYARANEQYQRLARQRPNDAARIQFHRTDPSPPGQMGRVPRQHAARNRARRRQHQVSRNLHRRPERAGATMSWSQHGAGWRRSSRTTSRRAIRWPRRLPCNGLDQGRGGIFRPLVARGGQFPGGYRRARGLGGKDRQFRGANPPAAAKTLHG